MELNADFSQRAVVHAAALPWIPSPMAGVDRRMLDRIGEEVARATSIVRYAPERSLLAPHPRRRRGVPGARRRVPGRAWRLSAGLLCTQPTDHAAPTGLGAGCTIFVKLWQFDADDRTEVRIDTGKQSFAPAPGRPGVEILPLFHDTREDVRLERWAGDTSITLDLPGGIEVLVLDGGFAEGGESFAPQSWLRLPAGARLTAKAGPDGARVWIKAGHLALPQSAP